MDSSNKRKELSLKFYSFLCDIIGTEEVVNKRRYIFAINEFRGTHGRLIEVNSGSRAEGFHLTGSDRDIMIVDIGVQVFESLDRVKRNKDNVSLIMDTENIKLGFTKLLIHYLRGVNLLSACIDRRTGCSYLSSALYCQYCYDVFNKSDRGLFCIHGPCTASADGECDIAFSLHCKDWISQAQPWIERSKYSWAPERVIQNILSFGVLFVPIGSKNSPYTDLEWRISFSYAEKQLIFCFNHVQFLCYGLLKILLKDIIKKTFDDLLCSYFMKTIMFWLCEETSVSIWKAENILSCFMACFKRLVYCVDTKTCLHFFIPEINLFENRFDSQYKNLLSTLRGLYDSGWTCLLQTETLRPFGNTLDCLLTRNILRSTYLLDLIFLQVTSLKNYKHARALERCLYNCFRSKKEGELYIFFISSLCQFFAQKCCVEQSVARNNKILYEQSRRRLANLLIGVNHDAASGWLLLASFFFTNKQYIVYKILVEYCFTKFSSEKCETIFEIDFWKVQHFIAIQNIIGRRCLKHFIICMVKLQENSCIIPDELNILIENEGMLYIPSLVYARFLNFLFYHTIGDEREKRKAYCNLLLTSKYKELSITSEVRRTKICQLIADNLIQCTNTKMN